MVLACFTSLDNRPDMNWQRQAVECKSCPGVVHSCSRKTDQQIHGRKTVSLMRRKGAFQVSCHVTPRSSRIRSSANLLMYLPFIKVARFYQKTCDVLGC